MSSDLFLDDESSIQGARPVELYAITQSAAVLYLIASGTRDVVYSANTYVASPAARTEVTTNTTTNDGQLTLALPLSHPFAQRWTAQGSPPTQPRIVISRQETNGSIEPIKTGVIVSMSIEGHLAKFLIQAPLARLLTRRLPVLNADSLCEHVLYDRNCRADPNLFSLGVAGSAVPTLTITGFDGRLVTVNSIGGMPAHWAQLGVLIHLTTLERMTILDQDGTIITMQAPLPGIAVNDQIVIQAGCAKDILTCRNKFANQVNFSGFPQLPTVNPFLVTGYGVAGLV